MITRLFLLLLVFAIATGTVRCLSEDVEVPKGVVYKTVDQYLPGPESPEVSR